MNILTLSDEKWLDLHAVRFVRFARRSNPTAKLILIYAGERNDSNAYILSMFDDVRVYPADIACRDWYNTVRLKYDELAIGDYLYVDVDVDILQDLSDIEKQPGDILWARSPSVSMEWVELCDRKGWKNWGANNGLLYVRQDYSQRYSEILRTLKAEGCSQRLVGTYAFNQMVRENKEVIVEMPYYNGVIWWDYDCLTTAKTIHWCNSRGQARREDLERIWREAI